MAEKHPWFVVSVPGEEDRDAALQKLKTKIQSANASAWAAGGPAATLAGPTHLTAGACSPLRL